MIERILKVLLQVNIYLENIMKIKRFFEIYTSASKIL